VIFRAVCERLAARARARSSPSLSCLLWSVRYRSLIEPLTRQRSHDARTSVHAAARRGATRALQLAPPLSLSLSLSLSLVFSLSLSLSLSHHRRPFPAAPAFWLAFAANAGRKSGSCDTGAVRTAGATPTSFIYFGYSLRGFGFNYWICRGACVARQRRK